MEPIRVQIDHSYEVPVPEFLEDFVGAYGTVVWATSAWDGGFQVSIELDEPNPIFGNFLQIGYMGTSRKNELVPMGDLARVRELAMYMGDRWNKFHTDDGDCLTWDEVNEILEASND